jgi:hypothetical protein
MMKTKIAMVISIAGVLVAGSAAALVNTQVLSGSSSPSLVTVGAAPPTPTATAVSIGTTAVVSAGSVVETPVVPASGATQAVYLIADSGTVTLDAAGDVLTIVAVAPATGWTVTKSEAHDATNVEVKFQSGTTEVDFHANLLLGVVTTSVESNDGSVTNSSVDDNGSAPHGGDDGNGHGGDDD